MDFGKPTIEVNVVLTGAEKAAAAVAGFGTQGQAAVKRVEDAYRQVAASAMDFARAGANAAQIAQLTGSSMKDAREAATLYAKTLATTEEEIRGVKLANQELATSGFLAVTKAGPSAAAAMNSVRASMTSMTASALQAVPGVSQVVSVLGNFAIGAGPMVAILAGIAAVTVAWKAQTEGMADAKKAQEELTTSLLKWYDTQKQGAAGEFPKQIEAMTKRVKELREELEKMNSGGIGGTVAAVGAGGSKVMGWVRTAAAFLGGGSFGGGLQLGQEVAKGTAAVAAEIKKGGDAIVAAQREVARRITEEQAKDIAEVQRLLIGEMDLRGQAVDGMINRLKGLDVHEMTNRLTLATAATKKFAEATQDLYNAMRVNVKPAQLPGFPDPAQAKKYADDMHRIWSDGLSKVLTDGLKSWQDFFEDVLQLFSNLMKRMQQEGKAGGLGGKLLGVAQAGIAGGIAGYQTGQAIGSPGLGALGGAASGALAGGAIGSVVPVVGTAIGAIVGGLAGLTAGLIGGSKAAHERAVAEEQLRQSLTQSLTAMKVQLGIIDPLSAALMQNAEAFKQLRAATEAAYAGSAREAEREARLRELNDLEAKRAQQLADQATRESTAAVDAAAAAAREAAEQTRAFAEAARDAAAAAEEASRKMNRDAAGGYAARYLTATGQDDLAFYFRQSLEYQSAVEQGLKDGALSMLRMAQAAETEQREQARRDAQAQQERQTQTDILKQQAQSLQDSVNAQREILNTTRQSIEGAQKYLNAGLLGAGSPLGPEARYEEARRQYLALGSLADQGDVKAFSQLPDAIEAFRRESRNVFGSTSRGDDDFRSSQIYLRSLTDKFGVQATVQERMLAELQAQSAKLQQQIASLSNIDSTTKAAPVDYVSKYKEWYENWYNSMIYDPSTGRDPTNPGIPRQPGDPTGGPGGGRPQTKNLDDVYERLGNVFSALSDIGAKAYSQLDYAGRVYTRMGDIASTQNEYQRQISNNTKSTSDGVSRLRPGIDIG